MNTSSKVALVIFGVICFIALMQSCSTQSITKNWGGEMEISLEPNQKLLEVTWKNDSLWFLTKDMTNEDSAESYRFYEKDTLGILEGCVYINEIKLSEKELAEYKAQQQYATDYYLAGNYDENGEVYIHYDVETNNYVLLKPYRYGEDGGLISAY